MLLRLVREWKVTGQATVSLLERKGWQPRHSEPTQETVREQLPLVLLELVEPRQPTRLRAHS